MIEVRLAKEKELERVNELRMQVYVLHAAGKSDVFKPGFHEEVRNYIHTIWNDPEQTILIVPLPSHNDRERNVLKRQRQMKQPK